MCTDCNEITIPTGATGATGAAGSNGTNGTSGLPGDNGTSILNSYNSITGVGTNADLLEKILYTYTLGASEFDNQDELELYIAYNYTQNNATTLRIKLGVKVVTIPVVNTENTINFLKVKVSRVAANSQLWTIEQTSINGLGVMSITYLALDSSTLDLTLGITLEVTGQNVTTATANQLLLKKCSLYKYNI